MKGKQTNLGTLECLIPNLRYVFQVKQFFHKTEQSLCIYPNYSTTLGLVQIYDFPELRSTL